MYKSVASKVDLPHSLGGRNALYLAAIDKRIKAIVISASLSPSHSNIYRGLKRSSDFQPKFWKAVKNNGKFPWEVNEIIAFVSPKPLLFIKPYNAPVILLLVILFRHSIVANKFGFYTIMKIILMFSYIMMDIIPIPISENLLTISL